MKGGVLSFYHLSLDFLLYDAAVGIRLTEALFHYNQNLSGLLTTVPTSTAIGSSLWLPLVFVTDKVVRCRTSC